MKFTLKNRPKILFAESSFAKWFEGFEKELKRILKEKEHPSLVTDWEVAQFIKEILGE